MFNRQKIYIGVAAAAGICTGVGLFVYLRHRRQIALSKSTDLNSSSVRPSSFFSSIKSRQDNQYTDITSSSQTNDSENESIQFKTDGGATIELTIPSGTSKLTPEQAIVLVRFLEENTNNIELLNRILTNIANAATFNENQNNLVNAGCIDRLRELLSTINNETTLHQILLALNNLALNEYAITHYSGIISIVINVCERTPSVRLHGLNLLMNMSVLEYLHNEFMENIEKLEILIQITFADIDQMLSASKILVNLSTNKANLNDLLKLTGIQLKTIVTICTPSKKQIHTDRTSKYEDILLRYIRFYCNLADFIINEHRNVQCSKINIQIPNISRSNAVYFELFDHEKQIETKSILRPQYNSNEINQQIKYFRQLIDTIRQQQFESNVSSIHNEFDDNEQLCSTPKKTPPIIDENHFEQLVNDEFDDDDDDDDNADETLLAGKSTPSDQSLASFRSVYSTNENNTFTSPENSLTN